MRNNQNKLLLILQIICLILGLGLLIIPPILETKFIFINIIGLLELGVVFFYFIYGYKIPHSNIFRYSMFIYAVLLGVYYLNLSAPNEVVGTIIKYDMLLDIALIAYMSGRLNKTEEVSGIMLCVTALLFVNAFILLPEEASLVGYLVPFSQAIIWTSFMISYFLRKDAHLKLGYENRKDGTNL